jgi:hypothetical protein
MGKKQTTGMMYDGEHRSIWTTCNTNHNKKQT